MYRIASIFVSFAFTTGICAEDPSKILDGRSTDGRLPLKDLNGYFPFSPPKTKAEWEKRKAALRTQILVSQGLFPLPEKVPLKPVFRDKVERDDYTVEGVSFTSLPGHYVTGSLFRPKNGEAKHPAILCPHGHWANARFLDVGEKEAQRQIAIGAEKYLPNARYFLQAKCAQLACMGFVVFMIDMVGSADSTAIAHREGFRDTKALLELQSFMGLQTWNAIRAVDFLEALPDVDSKRIGATGASGGGTQTFILGAIDDRIAAEFPAVMVGTAMQGGCVCENAPLLRVGTGNVEIAGLFAPKPLAMSGADDWTKEIETKGYPELKRLYEMYGAGDEVYARAWPEFKHNYNLPARELMYSWFNKHLLGKNGKVSEKLIVPIEAKELRVFDAAHPRPADETDAAGVRKWMSGQSAKVLPTMTPERLREALKALIADELPAKEQLRIAQMIPERKLKDGTLVHGIVIGRQGEADAIPCMGLIPAGYAGRVVVWVHPKGKSSLFDDRGEPAAGVRQLLDAKFGVLSFDGFMTGELAGEKKYTVKADYPGFTFGYNRSILAQRVHDTLTAISLAKNIIGAKSLHLVGWGSAGPQVIVARALAGDAIEKTSADLDGFSFEKIASVSDERMLPGAIKYGGMEAFIGLCAPHPVFVHNGINSGTGQPSAAAYATAKAQGKLVRKPQKADVKEVVDWLAK